MKAKIKSKVKAKAAAVKAKAKGIKGKVKGKCKGGKCCSCAAIVAALCAAVLLGGCAEARPASRATTATYDITRRNRLRRLRWLHRDPDRYADDRREAGRECGRARHQGRGGERCCRPSRRGGVRAQGLRLRRLRWRRVQPRRLMHRRRLRVHALSVLPGGILAAVPFMPRASQKRPGESLVEHYAR